jgi:UDP-N-acetylmuramate dehydrogenase
MKLIFKKNFPLAKLTSTRTGGPARFFCEVKNEGDLVEALKYAKKERIKWVLLGDGTNTIAYDIGFDGLVMKNEMAGFKVGGKIYIGSGEKLDNSVRKLDMMGFGGMEKLIKIPGTIGGAIYGCSGAHGQEIKDNLVRVKCLDVNDLKIKWLNKKECKFDYRDSIFKKKKNLIILGGEFKLQKVEPSELAKLSREIIKKRKKIYSDDMLCPGSYFKNIVVKSIKPISLKKTILAKLKGKELKGGKIPCGYLLEQVGAKKMKIGKIGVSKTHSNFIYNSGGGKTSDILKLAEILKKKVKEKFGIQLEEEVQYI